RVADRVPIEAQLVVEEQLDVAGLIAQVAHHDLAHVHTIVGIDRVITTQPQSDGVVLQQHVRDQRVAEIFERPLPRRLVDRVQRAVAPDAEAEFGAGVVLHSDVREVEVGEAILRVERDEEGAVADGEIARHGARVYTRSTKAVNPSAPDSGVSRSTPSRTQSRAPTGTKGVMSSRVRPSTTASFSSGSSEQVE